MEELEGNPFDGIFINGIVSEIGKIMREALERTVIFEQIEKLDPNLLTEKEVDKISKIYAKETPDITEKDIKYVDKIYEKYKKEETKDV